MFQVFFSQGVPLFALDVCFFHVLPKADRGFLMFFFSFSLGLLLLGFKPS